MPASKEQPPHEWIPPDVAAFLRGFDDAGLRVYLWDRLCPGEVMPNFHLVRNEDVREAPWLLPDARHMRYMVEPGEGGGCLDYEVRGASTCRTEREALELWCAYFWLEAWQ